MAGTPKSILKSFSIRLHRGRYRTEPWNRSLRGDVNLWDTCFFFDKKKLFLSSWIFYIKTPSVPKVDSSRMYHFNIDFFISSITATETPRRSISFAMKETPEENSQEKIATPTTQENVNASPSPNKPSLRRSKRRSSNYLVSLAESPLDFSFSCLDDSPEHPETPEKQSRKTPNKTPKKNIATTTTKTPSKTPKTTPKKATNRSTPLGRALDLNVDDCEYEYYDDTVESPPKRARKTPSKTSAKTPIKTPSKTPKRTPSTRISALDPVIGERKTPVRTDRSDVQLAKESLHVSAVPKTLPCRENEFRDAYKFIEGKILDESGGYVSIK